MSLIGKKRQKEQVEQKDVDIEQGVHYIPASLPVSNTVCERNATIEKKSIKQKTH